MTDADREEWIRLFALPEPEGARARREYVEQRYRDGRPLGADELWCSCGRSVADHEGPCLPDKLTVTQATVPPETKPQE